MVLNARTWLVSVAVIPLVVAACSASDIGGGSGSGSGGHTGSGGSTGGSASGGSTGSGGAPSTGSGGAGSGGSTMTGSGGAGRDAAADVPADMRGGTGGVRGGTGGARGTGGATGDTRCQAANLTWKTWKNGAKTNFESYPAPGSDECIKFSGCLYEGQFAACNDVRPESWVMTHNIVAAFPLGNLSLHDLCLKSGSKTIVVTVLDTCADSDCSGCCTQNKGSASLLIDIEKYTNQRFGVDDGTIQWADLGPTTGGGCQ